MKNLVFLLVFTPFLLKSQVYLGFSKGTHNQNYLRIHIEQKVSFTRIEVSYLTDFNEQYIQVKEGFGGEIGKWGFYGYIPFMNFSVKERKFNTPFSFEVFYSDYASLNFDIYKDVTIPSIRIKIPIVH